MKKSIQLFALLVVSSVMLFSCSNSQKPEDVAKQFTKALIEQKWEEAKKLSDDDTKGLIQLMQSFSGMGGAAISKDSAAKLNAQVEFVKSEVKDSTATVYFKDKASSSEQPLTLKKINGKWLVSMKKESMNKESMKKEGKEGENPANASGDSTGLLLNGDSTLLQSTDTSDQQ